MGPVNAHGASVVILGGGPGGYEAALVAAHLGADVTVVDRDGLGGAAVLTDCVPSKALISTADFMSQFETASDLGVHLEDNEGDEVADSVAELAAVNRRVLALAVGAVARHRRPAVRRRRDRRGRDRAAGVACRGRGDPGGRHDPDPPGRRGPRGHRCDPAGDADGRAGRRAHPHLAADLLPDRAARAPRRRRVRCDGSRAGPGVPRPGRPRHARLLARPGAARRGRRRRDGHRGRLPQAGDGGPRPVTDGLGDADRRRGRRPSRGRS